MTKTTNLLVGLLLPMTFLIAAQVKADMVKFTFAVSPTSANAGTFADVAGALSLTAVDNGNNGVDFVFASTWDGGENVNGGHGILMSTPGYYADANKQQLFLFNLNSIFSSGEGGILGTENPITKATGVVTNGYDEANNWNVQFTLNYTGGNDFDDFMALVNAKDSPFSVSVNLGSLDGTTSRTSYATFVTDSAKPERSPASTPEPATLAVWGLGLAGLGLVSRRRRK